MGKRSAPYSTLTSGLLGLLLGKIMLDTRGIAWPLAIHVAMDAAIYTFIAAAPA